MTLHRDIFSPALHFFSRERLDPLFVLLSRVLGGDAWGPSYAWYQLAVFFLGTVWCLAVLGAEKRARIAGALIATSALYSLFGPEPAYLKLHWFPALVAGTAALWKERTRPGIATLISILWVATAGALAVFGACVILLIYSFLGPLLGEVPKSAAAKRELTLVWFILFVGGVALVPVYPMPDYPVDAQLVPISPLTFYEAPLMGHALIPRTVLDSAYLELLRVYTLRFGVLSGCVLLIYLVLRIVRGSSGAPRVRDALLLLGGALFLVMPEWLFSYDGLLEQYRGQTPYPVLSRLVPGLGIANLGWLVLPFFLFGAVVLVTLGTSLLEQLVLVALFAGASWFFPRMFPLPENASTRLLNPVSHEEQMRFSPSYYAMETFGAWIASPAARAARKEEALIRLEPGKDFEYTVLAEPKPDEALRAFDGRYETRWGTGHPQREGDSFAVTFPRPIVLVRTVLSVRATPTDFPRGLEVVIKDSGGRERTVLRQPDWLGPLRWTPNGYPYFGPQSDVVIDFPKEEEITGIRFKLIGKGSSFDWSINELRLYRFAQAVKETAQ